MVNHRIPPNNNNATERALRELVIHRKIRRAALSPAEWFGSVFTCSMTWKNRGLDLASKLVQYA